MATHDAEKELQLRPLRAGFGIFLASMSVIFVTLIAARYLTAGGRVGPYSQVLGAIITLFMLVSGFLARSGRMAIFHGNNATMRRYLSLSFWVGVLGGASIFLQWILLSHMAVPVTDPTAEVYYVLTGIWLLVALVAGFVLLAANIRGRRIGGYTVENHWDVDAATYFWTFAVFAWVVVYVVLYLL